MKGSSVSTPWRTVQQFISAANVGVFEVEIDTDSRETRCNCPMYDKKGTCKHCNFVNMKMKQNDGHYSIFVPNEVPEDLALEASDDPAKFREFVVNYGRIEVL